MINFDMKGGAEIDKSLRSIDLKVQRKIVSKALREGAKPIVKEAKQNAKKTTRTGTLWKSIKAVTGKSKRYLKSIVITTTKGKGVKHDAFYAHLVEFGTAHSRPSPFMRPALDAKADEAIKTVAKEIARQVAEFGK